MNGMKKKMMMMMVGLCVCVCERWEVEFQRKQKKNFPSRNCLCVIYM